METHVGKERVCVHIVSYVPIPMLRP